MRVIHSGQTRIRLSGIPLLAKTGHESENIGRQDADNSDTKTLVYIKLTWADRRSS